MSSTFNPAEFGNTSYEGKLDTSLPPIPDGDWQGQITKLTFRQTKNKDDGSLRVICDVLWEVISPEVKEATKMDKPSVRQSVFLDMTEQGALDFGRSKNVGLGRLRDALGQNTGAPWTFNHMMGALALISTKQRPDPDNPEVIYSDVKKVASL